jgi:hypothetical protein
MNSASNMIAKWYQTESNVLPKAFEKMLAMPTASDGAPPVRANNVLSPISVASMLIWSTVTGKPHWLIVATGRRGVGAHDAGRAVDREIDAGIEHARGNHRHDRDE